MIRHFSSKDVDTSVNYEAKADLTRDYNPQYGNKNAKVKVLFFKDFQCSHCADYSSITEDVVNSYTDNQNVLFVYKKGYLWDESKAISNAAYAAHEQGKFMEFYNLAFKNQEAYRAKGAAALKDWAKQINGLDYAKWSEDKDSEKIIKQVEWDHQDILNASFAARGEPIPLSVFTDDEGGITRGIIEFGGLFQYNVPRLQGQVLAPPVTTGPRPMTLAEKIIARHWVTDLAANRTGVPAVRPGDEGFIRTDIRFSHEYVTPMAAIFWRDYVGEQERVVDPESVFYFRDHLTFLDLAMTDQRKADGLLDVALELKAKQEDFAAQQGITLYGELPRLGQGRHGIPTGSEAISHSKILESHALPGHVIIGSDSHTPHAGALGGFAFGVGTTAVFNSWLTKDVRIQVPPSVLIRVNGRRPAGVTAKDFMLQILRHPLRSLINLS